jgi:hypothetical protein
MDHEDVRGSDLQKPDREEIIWENAVQKIHFMTTLTGALILAGLVSLPAFGEVDLAGNWSSRLHQDWQERNPGPEAVDYLGIPINEQARSRALSYIASIDSLPERQCMNYTPQYVVIGPQSIKMWSESDPSTGKIIAWKISAAPDRSILTIWMDGRPHPSKNAPHPSEGFTTGVWEGDKLTTYTTHIKSGYIRRNGVPSSDQATVTEHFTRHGDILTISALIDDPVYLTEPYVISRSWQLDPKTVMPPTPPPCVPAAEVARLDGAGEVPHILPGANTFTDEVTKMYHIPVEAVMGGAATMYPEYRKKLQSVYVAPVKCVRWCCGWEGRTAVDTLKDCIGDYRVTPGLTLKPSDADAPLPRK